MITAHTGVIVAVVRRKIGGQRKLRIRVEWKKTDRGAANYWYSRQEVDNFLADKSAGSGRAGIINDSSSF